MLQIAQQMGYAHQEILTRLFRKKIGMTTGEYSKNLTVLFSANHHINY